SLPDVGRRRHVADAPDFIEWILDAVQPHGGSFAVSGLYRNRESRLIEEHLRARLEPARRPDQRLPAVATIVLRTEQQHFSLSPIPTATEKPCRKDAAVIEHEKVTRLEVGGHISDGGMRQRFRR